MKKIIYAGIALLGSALSAFSLAHEQVKNSTPVNLLNEVDLEQQIINKKTKPFVFSDILKNNKNFTLAGHYSHYSHGSHRSHFSHSSHFSGY